MVLISLSFTTSPRLEYSLQLIHGHDFRTIGLLLKFLGGGCLINTLSNGCAVLKLSREIIRKTQLSDRFSYFSQIEIGQ
jgi:hypothetical protein